MASVLDSHHYMGLQYYDVLLYAGIDFGSFNSLVKFVKSMYSPTMPTTRFLGFNFHKWLRIHEICKTGSPWKKNQLYMVARGHCSFEIYVSQVYCK